MIDLLDDEILFSKMVDYLSGKEKIINYKTFNIEVKYDLHTKIYAYGMFVNYFLTFLKKLEDSKKYDNESIRIASILACDIASLCMVDYYLLDKIINIKNRLDKRIMSDGNGWYYKSQIFSQKIPCLMICPNTLIVFLGDCEKSPRNHYDVDYWNKKGFYEAVDIY